MSCTAVARVIRVITSVSVVVVRVGGRSVQDTRFTRSDPIHTQVSDTLQTGAPWDTIDFVLAPSLDTPQTRRTVNPSLGCLLDLRNAHVISFALRTGR